MCRFEEIKELAEKAAQEICERKKIPVNTKTKKPSRFDYMTEEEYRFWVEEHQ